MPWSAVSESLSRNSKQGSQLGEPGGNPRAPPRLPVGSKNPYPAVHDRDLRHGHKNVFAAVTDDTAECDRRHPDLLVARIHVEIVHGADLLAGRVDYRAAANVGIVVQVLILALEITQTLKYQRLVSDGSLLRCVCHLGHHPLRVSLTLGMFP